MSDGTLSLPRTSTLEHRQKKRWKMIQRSIWVQLVSSLLMQLSYVAFPAYNFALALWALAWFCPEYIQSHSWNELLLPLGVAGTSVVTNLIWIGLWATGSVFYDQFCGTTGVSILSCGGATDYFPGCNTHRFAVIAMVVCDLSKVVAGVCLYKVWQADSTVAGGTTSSPPKDVVLPINQENELVDEEKTNDTTK